MPITYIYMERNVVALLPAEQTGHSEQSSTTCRRHYFITERCAWWVLWGNEQERVPFVDGRSPESVGCHNIPYIEDAFIRSGCLQRLWKVLSKYPVLTAVVTATNASGLQVQGQLRSVIDRKARSGNAILLSAPGEGRMEVETKKSTQSLLSTAPLMVHCDYTPLGS